MVAVETLIVSDTLLREGNDTHRRQLEQLMHEAEKRRGKIVVVSTEHEAGS